MYVCAWKNGSFKGKALQSEPPLRCQVIGCPGEFSRLPPMLEGKILTCFLEDKSVSNVFSGVKTRR
jgi:hypothetical protein